MSKKILNVIDVAYRATLEEQDDPVVWLSHTLKAAGADVDVLLRGNAVNYLVRGQDASGLAFGQKRQTQPPRLDHDIASFLRKGAKVYYVEDDLAARGILASEILDEVTAVRRVALGELFAGYELVWSW